MKINLIISDSYYFVKETLNKIYGDFSGVIKVDFNNSSIEDIIYEFSSVSLFEEEKVVVVENAEDIFSKGFEDDELSGYLDNPVDLTTVIFISTKVDKNNIFYKKILKDYKVYDSSEKKKYNLINDVRNYVKSKKSHISDNALEYIKEASLNNYDLMLSEIDKLLILGKDNISDELVYKLVRVTPDGNNNRFINALLDMDEKEALKCVKNMETLNIDISKLLALIAWNVRVIYLIKKNRKDNVKLEEVLKLFNIKDYQYNQMVKRGNIRSEHDLENLLVELSNLDISLKSYKFDRDNLGYFLINLFCIQKQVAL